MKHVLPILLLASLTACGKNSMPPSRLSPVPPELPAELAAPCPMPSPLLSNDIAALTLKLAETAQLLGECAIKHAGTVNAHHKARVAAQEWNGEK